MNSGSFGPFSGYFVRMKDRRTCTGVVELIEDMDGRSIGKTGVALTGMEDPHEQQEWDGSG